MPTSPLSPLHYIARPMSIWYTAPEPATRLGRHRQLAPLAGIHVSPIALGAMSIGNKWAEFGMGAMDKESSFRLLDAYYEAGGNFIDTANDYQDESSEMFIGEWMEHRGVREQIVLATKYSATWKRRTPNSELPQKTHYVGNNVKSLRLSVEASLKKLRTTYLDILYVHWWDYMTSIEEVMDSAVGRSLPFCQRYLPNRATAGRIHEGWAEFGRKVVCL